MSFKRCIKTDVFMMYFFSRFQAFHWRTYLHIELSHDLLLDSVTHVMYLHVFCVQYSSWATFDLKCSFQVFFVNG